MVEASNTAPNTKLTGWPLWMARVVWLAVVLLVLGLQIAGFRPYFRELSSVCVGSTEVCEELSRLTPEQMETFAAAGITPNQYATLTLITDLLMLAIWIGVGIAIFILRSDDWMALLVSLFLVVFSGATFFSGPIENAAIVYPALSWVTAALTVLGEFLITAFFLLFPNGRIVPRWLWWLLPVRVVLAALEYVPGFTALSEWASFLTFFPPLVLLLAAQVYRYRQVSTLRERYQTRWVLFGLTYGVGTFLVGIILSYVFGAWQSVWSAVIWLIMNLFISLVPVSIGIAMLRSKLWDIDVVIRRTTVYAVLTALLAVVYFGSVVVLQRLLSPFTGESTPAVVLSTLLIAALFLPLRRRVQSAIDRRFYRRKYDAQKTLEQFSQTVRDETDLDALTAELVRVIQETMQPEHVSVWLRPTAAETAPRPVTTAAAERVRKSSYPG